MNNAHSSSAYTRVAGAVIGFTQTASQSLFEKLKEKLGALSKRISTRYHEGKLEFSAQLDIDIELCQRAESLAKLAVVSTKPITLKGILINRNDGITIPLYEGVNRICLAPSGIISTQECREEGFHNLELKAKADSLELLEESAQTSKFLWTNDCLSIGPQSFVVKLLPSRLNVKRLGFVEEGEIQNG